MLSPIQRKIPSLAVMGKMSRLNKLSMRRLQMRHTSLNKMERNFKLDVRGYKYAKLSNYLLDKQCS